MLLRIQFLAFVLVVTLISGCGDGLSRVNVQGTVKLGGQVVDGVSVQFMPESGTKGEGALGRTDSQGKYKLIGSRQGHEGIVPGAYRVRLSRLAAKDGTALPDDAKDADHPGSYESIPAPYSTPESTLKMTVKETGGELNIEIPGKLIKRK